MKKINILSISLLVAMFIASTTELHGMTVKAIDEKINLVSGFLPYYLDNGDIHALLGKYTDATLGDIYSAPVEMSGDANANKNVNSIIKKYIASPLKVSPLFKVAYSINTSNKNYYLWTVEVNPADVDDLKQSLLNQVGNDPMPIDIVDINLNAYIPGIVFSAKIRPGKTEVLYTEFMKRSMYGLGSTLEMKMARGFSDLFQAFTSNKNQLVLAFPVTDVKSKLKELASVLGNLAAALSVPEITSSPESESIISSEETPVPSFSQNAGQGLTPEEAQPQTTQSEETETEPETTEEAHVISSEDVGLTPEEIPSAPGNPFGGD